MSMPNGYPSELPRGTAEEVLTDAYFYQADHGALSRYWNPEVVSGMTTEERDRTLARVVLESPFADSNLAQVQRAA